MSSIASIASGLLHAVLPTSLLPNNTTTSSVANVANIAGAPVARRPDIGQLSSFGQVIGTLQQLQQSNPAQYQQVTQSIATNLQSAAQTAQSSGDRSTATRLNQLSTDFRNASAAGQLPNLRDLANAVGGHRGYHHAHGIADSANSGNSSALANQAFLATSNGVQGSATDAAAIIQNTLSNAGISA